MSYNLLDSKSFHREDNIDLEEILFKFYRNFKFTENKRLIEDGLKAKTLDQINLFYDQQSQLAQTPQWIDLCQKTLSEISPEFKFSKILSQVKRGHVLDVENYIQVFHVLNSYLSLGNTLPIAGTTGIPKQGLQKQFKDFFKECDSLFDFKSNTLVTYKHPRLKPIDKKIQEASKEIRIRLSKISLGWQKEELLQQNEFDVFDDKFVLPVRSDRFNGGLGKIIHRSKTGNTLFVEPHALRELSNILEELRAELEREIYQLLQGLVTLLSHQVHSLNNIFHYILTLDAVRGRLRAAENFNLTRPEINNSGILKIDNIFHPLIENPVKNNLSIRSHSNGLLISGPNTGGKTVLLKSICLCTILPHLGFFVPASDANIPFYRDIFFMSHDNQSLLDGLSSFSSEATDYLKTIKEIVDGKGIIFIDEIFNTTSSVEASALATALIKELSNRKTKTFISSHHEALKESIFNSGLLDSGHMGFKKETNTPTYVFHHGSPGKSFAKEVFLKLEKEVLEYPDITRWLGQELHENRILDSKIQNLDDIKEDSLRLKEKYESILIEIEKEKENAKNILSIERRKLESEFDKKWAKLKKETLDLVEKAKRGEVKNIVKVTQELSKIRGEVTEESGVEDSNSRETVGTVDIGDWVFVSLLNKEGRVLKINKDKAYIEAGKLKSWIPLDKLQTASQSSPSKNETRIKVQVSKNQEGRGLQLDARGLRRDAFLSAAEKHIMDVLNGDIPFVDIIHGHGDGILKKSLYELLNENKDELKFDFIEGNMGTTRVELLD